MNAALHIHSCSGGANKQAFDRRVICQIELSNGLSCKAEPRRSECRRNIPRPVLCVSSLIKIRARPAQWCNGAAFLPDDRAHRASLDTEPSRVASHMALVRRRRFFNADKLHRPFQPRFWIQSPTMIITPERPRKEYYHGSNKTQASKHRSCSVVGCSPGRKQ